MTNAGTKAQFRCYFTNDDSTATDGSIGNASPTLATPASSLIFQQEEGKKSSFLVTAPQDDDDVGCDKPASLCVDAIYNHDRVVPFVLGGFEIVTNSRNIEVYIVSDTDDAGNKETYLTTCRGIKVVSGSGDTDGQDDKWFKALLVIPGGPRSMMKLRLKLLSVRPPSETKSLLQYMKLKGRLPDVQLEQSEQQQQQKQHQFDNAATQSTLHNHTHTQHPSQQQQQQQGLSVSDISAALAGVSMMVHGTEERITRALQSSLNQLGQGVATRLQGVEQVVVMQSTAVQQLQFALQQQNQIIQQQAQMIQEMRQQQAILMDTLTTVLGSNQIMNIHTESSGPSKAHTAPDLIECTNGRVLDEDDDSKPPSRMRIEKAMDDDSPAMPETTTTIEEASDSSGTYHEQSMVAPVLEGESGADLGVESGVDEDSKPPSRSRTDGEVAVVYVSASPATTKQDEKGVIEIEPMSTDSPRVVETDDDQAAVPAVEPIPSTHVTRVLEDDDSKPPSRPRVDDDIDVAPLDQVATPRSEPATWDDQQGSTKKMGIVKPSPPAVPAGVVSVEGDKATSAPMIEDEEKKAEDDMILFDDMEDDDDDKPVFRSRQVDDETDDLLVTLEPPDKGCGDPNDTTLDTDDGVDADLIDFS
jgi:hypothetical protein